MTDSPTIDAGVRRALRVNWENLALGHPTIDADGATFVADPELPRIYDANFVYGATASTPTEIDRLWTRAHSSYAHADRVTFRVDPASPPAFEAWLALVGAERHRTLVMLLEGALRAKAPAHDLRPIDDDAGWDALRALKRSDWRDHAPKLGEDPERTEIPDGLTAAGRKKCPPVQYFLAYVDGTPVGFCNGWEGVEGTGQVEDLFVLPTHRRRGIAAALIQRCAGHARERGAGPLVICADVADTPKAIYAAMGWRPIAVCRQYQVMRAISA